MIEHAWSVLCSDSAVDIDSNLISIFNVVEGVEAITRGEPQEGSLLPVPMLLVSLWMKSDRERPENGLLRVSILEPGREPIAVGREIAFSLTRPRLRTRNRLGGLPIHRSGDYRLLIEFRSVDSEEWRTATLLPLDVSIRVGELPVQEEAPQAPVRRTGDRRRR
jgi:hypothetical protein